MASRSDLINILNHTLHGGKSVLGVGGPDGQADNAGILNKALFGTHGSDVNLQGSDENPSFHFGSQNTPGDSPGGLFRMDLVNETPPSSRRELERGPSMLFPVTLSANPPPESIDPNLETRASSTSGGSNSMFSVNDTAMDDNPGVLRAPPPPSRPLSPTPLFQHAQQDPNGRPLQSSPLLFHQSEAGPPQGLDANPNPPSLFPIPQQGKQQLPQQGLFPMPQQAQGPQPGQLQGSDSRPSSPPVYQQGQQQVPQQGLFPLPQQGQPQVPPAEQPRQDDMSTQQQLQQQPSLRHQLPRPPSSSALSRQGSLQGLDVEQPPGLPQSAPPPRRMKLYAYGIADPEYMSLPCKMSMKHARVTVNHETNNRLYGKKLPGQVSISKNCACILRASPSMQML